MYFIDEIDESLPNSFQNNFLLEENKTIIPFSIDESELPKVEDEKCSLPKNLFITKKPIKEKIKHQKLLLEKKRVLTEKEKKEIYFNKKEDLKKRNRESAQKSRDKKKLEFMQIIAENKKLKDEIYIINSKINLLCSGCRTIFDLKTEDTKDNNNNNINNICINCTSTNNNAEEKNIEEINDNIFNSPTTTSSFNNLKVQKLFNFILISLFAFFCIFEIISNFQPNNNINIENTNDIKIRNIKEVEENRNIKININKNNDKSMISIIDSDYFFKKNNYNIDPNIKLNINSNNEHKSSNNHYKNEVCEKDFFTSFQCQKKSFKSFISKIDNNDNNNEDIIKDNIKNKNDKNEHLYTTNNNKNSIYFNLFVQSCSKDEVDTDQSNSINYNPHYIFSSDNNMCQDFYYFCQRTET